MGTVLAIENSPLETHAALTENSRLGFQASVSRMRRTLADVNPKNASGMGDEVRREGVRPRSTGKERDAETRLDFFGLRYYSATQGRFLSSDPNSAGASLFSSQSWNAYTYVLNNPYKYVDLDGDIPIPVVTALAGGAVGATFGAASEAVAQLVGSGFDIYKVDTSKIGNAFVAGAVSGAVTD